MVNLSAVAVIRCGNKFLLGRKRDTDEWSFLEERLREGATGHESDYDALLRCAIEKVGMRVVVGRHLCGSRSEDGKISAWYECMAKHQNPSPDGSLEEAVWVDRKEISERIGEKGAGSLPTGMRKYFNLPDVR